MVYKNLEMTEVERVRLWGVGRKRQNSYRVLAFYGLSIENIQPDGWMFSMVGRKRLELLTSSV